MVRAAHAVISCVDILCGRNSVARIAKDNMNNINALAFYHEIRWDLTFSGISQISIDQWAKHWCWSLRIQSAARLFAEVFRKDDIKIQA
jgi:hypothetical protein